jgi:hypothetical protein
MAAARELPAGQNWSDLDHGRARELGEKKEEREGVRFHALPAAEMHRGDRISRRKMKGGSVHPFQAVLLLCWFWRRPVGERQAGGGRAGLQGGAT